MYAEFISQKNMFGLDIVERYIMLMID